MPLTPIYTPANTSSPAYHLRYTWTGWPSSGRLPEFSQDLLDGFASALQADCIRPLENSWSPDQVQFTCSVMPQVAPTLFAARMKGRLQHLLRQRGQPASFSRKVAVRTIGDNRTEQVEAYIRQHAAKEQVADPVFREFLDTLTFVDESVDLSQPTETRSGRYWYNLHLVVVAQERYRTRDKARLLRARDQSLKIAERKGHRVSVVSVVPEHLHISMRGNIEHCPEEIALAFMNNLAYTLGQNAIWQFGYYVGTFGEYDIYAVRQDR